MPFEKEQQIETTKKLNQILLENAVEAVKPYFAPQNMFNLAFHERQNCGIGSIINENT